MAAATSFFGARATPARGTSLLLAPLLSRCVPRGGCTASWRRGCWDCARPRGISLYSHSRSWRRGGRRGRNRDTCRAPGSPRLGLGVAGWLRARWRLPIALVRSKRGAGGVTMVGACRGKAEERGGERWGMTGGGRLSAARGGSAGRGRAARLAGGPSAVLGRGERLLGRAVERRRGRVLGRRPCLGQKLFSNSSSPCYVFSYFLIIILSTP